MYRYSIGTNYPHCLWLIVCLIACVNRLPYVEAMLLEVLRYKTLTPLGIAHSTLKDTEVGGFFIPRGTTVSWQFYFMVDIRRPISSIEYYPPIILLHCDHWSVTSFSRCLATLQWHYGHLNVIRQRATKPHKLQTNANCNPEPQFQSVNNSKMTLTVT